MTAASYAEIVELLGDVDDLFLKRIEETGASLDEITEALGQVEDQPAAEDTGVLATSPRVATVRSILEEMLEDSEDDLDARGYSIPGA
jgi:division protein CdvB (Snf7/Vps24/ESCRT-III family)